MSCASVCLRILPIVCALSSCELRLDVVSAAAFVDTTSVRTLYLAVPLAAVAANLTWILHPALHPIASITAGLLTLAAVASVVTLLGLRSHIEEGLESALLPARRAARNAMLQLTSNIVKLPCRENPVSEVLSTLTESLAAKLPPPLRRVSRDEKRRRVEQALMQTGGNQAAAARLLGLTPSNLARLMKSVGAKPPDSMASC